MTASKLDGVIQSYHAARDAAHSASEELDALSKRHKQILGELKTLRERIAHYNAVIQELRSKCIRGLSSNDEIIEAKAEHQRLLDALNETQEMDATARKIAAPLQQRVQQQHRKLEHSSKSVWDTVAQHLYTEAPPFPEQWLKAYAAAKNGTFPPGSLGAWLDEKLGTTNTEEYARDVAAEYGL
jgi:chromosome segregation ATPase